MEELNQLFARAQAGDLDAYGRIVRRFQNMAVGYAYSILGDFHLAEDVSQEAFIETYLHFNKLYGPAVFPSWLRRAVFKHCDRLTRRRQVATIPLEAAPQLPSHEPTPDEAAAAREMEDSVKRAIQTLPENERAVTALFYIGGHSQSEIGAFLEIPPKTVKSRLHTARKRLRERMIDMVEEQLRDRRPSRDENFTVRVIDDLALLTDFEIQRLLREVKINDLIVALRGTGADVQERIFANVSKVIATLIKNEMAISGPVDPSDIETVRTRIVELAQQLAPVESKTPAGSKVQPVEEYQQMKDDLKQLLGRGPFARLGFDELEEIFHMMAQVCRREGILTLETEGIQAPETAAAGAEEEFFNLGRSLIVDGTAPRLTETILSTRMQALMHDHATRYRMIVEGLRAIKAVNYPAFMDLNLRNFYMSEQKWDGDYAENPAQVLKEKLREKPFSQFTLDEVTRFLLDLSVAVRKEGDAVLAELTELVDDELLEHGLETMQMFGGSIVPGLVQRMLEIRTRTLLHRHETRYQMIAEGFRSIQNGENPRVIAQKLRNFYE